MEIVHIDIRTSAISTDLSVIQRLPEIYARTVEFDQKKEACSF